MVKRPEGAWPKAPEGFKVEEFATGLANFEKSSGRTILLTTHYMDEAEKLCDRVAIMDHGNVIALDTPRRLIAALRFDRVLSCKSRNIDLDAPETVLDLVGIEFYPGEDPGGSAMLLEPSFRRS